MPSGESYGINHLSFSTRLYVCLGGNAQADIMTFGRISGQSADAYLKTLKK